MDETTNLHGPHCWDSTDFKTPVLVCGWPDMHRPAPRVKIHVVATSECVSCRPPRVDRRTP